MGARIAVLGSLTLLTGTMATVAVPALAAAADGTATVTCRGADDDRGAVVSGPSGPISSASAVGNSGISIPAPASMSYTFGGIPESTGIGSTLPVTFQWGGDSHLIGALADQFLPPYGLTTATVDPIVTSLAIVGPATHTGLTATTTASFPLSGTDTPAPVSLSGTVTTTAAGVVTVQGSQRITFPINKDVNYQGPLAPDGISVRVNSLTFVCTTEVLATMYVVAAGAPIARLDDFAASGLVIDKAGAASGTTTFDVLANDSPTASAIDPATLTVTNAGPFTTSVVDGKIVVTGTNDFANWLYENTIEESGACQSNDPPSQAPSASTTYTCAVTVDYSICTVDQSPLCSASQAAIEFTTSAVPKPNIPPVSTTMPSPTTVPSPGTAPPATPVPARPTFTG